ncbi:MAG: DUF2330 domain-containing protein [Patescibacteria group bacterium]|nr:DUF2330 domain-containing protein [Patescibacteria group bacterium]
MSKIQKNKISILFFSVIFCLFNFSLVKADGIFIPFESEDLYEPYQTALIVFDNNNEELYLNVGYQGDASKFVWIVPTPNLPKVTKAPADLFIELHEITKPKIKYESGYKNHWGSTDLFSDEEKVTVHSKEKIGSYEVSVLSAEGSESLYKWLRANQYQAPEEAKELLDWYINKNWFFTAMRISEDENKGLHPIKLSFKTDKIIYPLKITQFSTLDAGDYISKIISIRPELEKYKNNISVFFDHWLDICAEEVWLDIKNGNSYNENLLYNQPFNEITYSKNQYDFYENRWWKKNNTSQWFENEARGMIKKGGEEALMEFYDCGVFEGYEFDRQNIVEDFVNQVITDFQNRTEYPDYIKNMTHYGGQIPRGKINETRYHKVMWELEKSFPYYTEDGIKHDIKDNLRGYFPKTLRKIIEKNNKTNELLLYVLTKNKVKAPGFRLEYANWVDPKLILEKESSITQYRIDNLNNLKSIVNKKYFLTKLRRAFAKEEMDDDLYVIADNYNFPYHLTISRNYDSSSLYNQEIRPLSLDYKNKYYKTIIYKEKLEIKDITVYLKYFFAVLPLLLVIAIVASIYYKLRSKS